MDVEELGNGEIYVVDVENYPAFKSIFTSKGGKFLKNRMYFSGSFEKQNNGSWATTDYNMSFRLATPQEKEHLLQCIAAGKYVDYVGSKLSFNYLIL